MTKILGIESSCDETAVAVVEDGVKILSHLVASQIEIHARYGGVVPEVASRQHILAILPLLQGAMKEAQVTFADLSAIAVTVGPGLAGSLLVGVNTAKALAWAKGLPLLGINHLEGHIYANWLMPGEPPLFPALCLIVSGGHTDLVLMPDHGRHSLLGRSRDDAAGEAFDKVARILGLGYPGGPAIERASFQGAGSIPLPHAWLKGTEDFSFSGLKTAVLHLMIDREGRPIPDSHVADVAASFQKAVAEVLVTKTVEAAKKYGARQILLAGGVAANRLLRKMMLSRSPLPLRFPPPLLCTDNAAMIAACGYYRWKRGKMNSWDLDVVPGLKLGEEPSGYS